MPLILRAVKGSKLTIVEMDGNLIWLAGNISGSGVIPVTGSGINASNTPITSSFFVGDGSKLTNITASFITASNVYGPYGANSVLSSSFAISASFVLSSSYALTSSQAISASQAVSSSYALNADTLDGRDSSVFAITGSNIFTGLQRIQANNLVITGSLNQGLNNVTPNTSIYAHAEGVQVTASGYSSHAEGVTTQAKGDGSHAEGLSNISSGSYSHAEGRSNIAYGNYSHVEGGPSGLPNYTYGDYSHAEGGGNVTYGEGSHAEGYANQTSTAATYSHVAGAFNVTSASYQVVIGQYNARNNTSSLFIVGAGSAAGGVFKDAFSVEADFTQFPNPSHIVIPTNTLVPVNPKTGSMYYDTSTNKLWIWNGVWRSSSFGI